MTTQKAQEIAERIADDLLCDGFDGTVVERLRLERPDTDRWSGLSRPAAVNRIVEQLTKDQ